MLEIFEEAPQNIPKSTGESDEVVFLAALFIQNDDRSRVANSVAGGHGHRNGPFCALVPLLGVFLTIHYILNPEVASHLEVEPTVGAGVALGVAVVVVSDAHCLCAVDTRQIGSDSQVQLHHKANQRKKFL